MIAKRRKKGYDEIYPKFRLIRSNDLMTKGGDFYAIWDQEAGLWSTDENTAVRLIDQELNKYKEEHKDLLLEINEEYIENDEVVVDLATFVTDFNENEDDELAPKYEEVVSDVFTEALIEYKEVVGAEDYVDSGDSILAGFGKVISPIFTPLGFGSQLNENGWVYGVSAITGLIAKEKCNCNIYSIITRYINKER